MLIPRGFKIMVYVTVFNILFKEFIYMGPLISISKIFESGSLLIVASHKGIMYFVY